MTQLYLKHLSGGIDIPDDKKLQFGAGQDLQIYHEFDQCIVHLQGGLIKGGNIV